jgi:hypothetical protein
MASSNEAQRIVRTHEYRMLWWEEFQKVRGPYERIGPRGSRSPVGLSALVPVPPKEEDERQPFGWRGEKRGREALTWRYQTC